MTQDEIDSVVRIARNLPYSEVMNALYRIRTDAWQGERKAV